MNQKDMLNRITDSLAGQLELMRERGIERLHISADAPPPAAASMPRPDAPRRASGSASPAGALEEIAGRVAVCERCPLSRTRTNTVPGEGDPNADILFVGEGPGAVEDRQGRPFVGPAGGILTRMIKAMGFAREQVFIANIVKCRPTVDFQMKKDRPPSLDEMEACLPYLKEQIAALKPKVIIAMGNTALEGLFGFRGITKRRGQWLTFEGIDTMPTYHPSFLLRGGGEGNARWWETWEDLSKVLERLGLPVPEKKRK